MRDESGSGRPPSNGRRLEAALDHPVYRRVLAYVRSTSSSVATLSEVAEHVAGDRDGNATDAVEDVEIRLHHVGFPKLAEAGVLDYDPRSRTVRYRGSTFLAEDPASLDEPTEAE